MQYLLTLPKKDQGSLPHAICHAPAKSHFRKARVIPGTFMWIGSLKKAAM